MAFCFGHQLLLVFTLMSAVGQEVEKEAGASSLEGTWDLIKITLQFPGEAPHQLLKEKIIALAKIDSKRKVVLLDDKIYHLEKIHSGKRPGDLDLIEKRDNKNKIIKCIYILEKEKLKACFHFGISRGSFHPFILGEATRPEGFDSQKLPIAVFYLQKNK